MPGDTLYFPPCVNLLYRRGNAYLHARRIYRRTDPVIYGSYSRTTLLLSGLSLFRLKEENQLHKDGCSSLKAMYSSIVRDH